MTSERVSVKESSSIPDAGIIQIRFGLSSQLTLSLSIGSRHLKDHFTLLYGFKIKIIISQFLYYNEKI